MITTKAFCLITWRLATQLLTFYVARDLNARPLLKARFGHRIIIYRIMNWDSLTLHGVNPTGQEIGRGAYGRVFEVNYEGTLCAAKEIHALLLEYARGDDQQKIIDDFLSECQIWSTLRHPCIVQFLGKINLIITQRMSYPYLLYFDLRPRSKL